MTYLNKPAGIFLGMAIGLILGQVLNALPESLHRTFQAPDTIERIERDLANINNRLATAVQLFEASVDESAPETKNGLPERIIAPVLGVPNF